MDTWSGWLTRSEQKTNTNTADYHKMDWLLKLSDLQLAEFQVWVGVPDR